MDQLCAALDEPGKTADRPAAQYLSAIVMSEPEREAVADVPDPCCCTTCVSS
jgi:hypothetical protein